MWNLDQTAKRYGQRPSELFGIDPDEKWLAWDFDQAVSSLGLWVEAKLAERDTDGKPAHKLYTLLGVKRKRTGRLPEGVIGMKVVKG